MGLIVWIKKLRSYLIGLWTAADCWNLVAPYERECCRCFNIECSKNDVYLDIKPQSVKLVFHTKYYSGRKITKNDKYTYMMVRNYVFFFYFSCVFRSVIDLHQTSHTVTSQDGTKCDVYNRLMWRCVYRASYCNVLMTNEMHSSYNQFLFHSFFLLYVFRTNLVVHHQQHCIIYCITQFGTIGTVVQASRPASNCTRLHDCTDCTKLCNTVYYAVRLACTIVPTVPNCVIQYIMPCCCWWTTRFVRNM